MWQCLYLQRSFPLPVLCYYFAGFGRFLGVNIFEWRWLLWVLLPVHQIQTHSVGGSPTRSIGICWPWKEVQLVTRLQMHTTDRSLYAVNSICRDLHKTKLMISGWVIKSHCHPFPLVLLFHFIPIQSYRDRSIELLHKRCSVVYLFI